MIRKGLIIALAFLLVAVFVFVCRNTRAHHPSADAAYAITSGYPTVCCFSQLPAGFRHQPVASAAGAAVSILVFFGLFRAFSFQKFELACRLARAPSVYGRWFSRLRLWLLYAPLSMFLRRGMLHPSVW